MVGQSKFKRRKVECLICKATFDSDYRKKHNEKHHRDMVQAHRNIPYQVAGAPANPFTLAKKMSDEVNNRKQMEEGQSSGKTASSSSTSLHETQTIETSETPTLSPTITDNVNKTVEETQKPEEAETVMGEEAPDATTEPIENQDETKVNAWLKSLGKYPTDVANFRKVSITPEIRAEIVKYGPSQPRARDIPAAETNERKFQTSWYTKNYNHRDWLVYSIKENKMFCFCCWLFPCKGEKGFMNNWGEVGLSNFKKGLEKICLHEESSLHIASLAKWKSFQHHLSRGKTIDSAFQQQLESEREKTLKILDRIFSATLFLALQGIAFRGHRFESQEGLLESFENSGNYLELLKLMARHDPVLEAHLGSKKSRGKYTSPHIQNEVISSIATAIRDNIVKEVQDAKYFCIILDTTPDVSHTDQLAFSVRYVQQDGKPVERFLCFEVMESCKAVDFRDKLLILLERYGLDPSLIRGQAMDGCSTMSGHIGGLQVLIREINSSALYVHCMAHRLNLVLVKAATNNTQVKSFFGLLEKLYSFFVASPKRILELHSEQERMNKKKQMPKAISDTRWAARASAVENVRDNFECYIGALGNLTARNELNASSLTDAEALIKSIMSFEFLIMLYLWFDFLSITKAATDKVQGPMLNVGISCQLVKSCVQQFSSMRASDKHFDEIIKKAEDRSASCEIRAEFTRKRVSRRKRFHDEDAVDDPIVDAKRRFKIEIYNNILDTMITDLEARFSNTTVGVLKALQCISPANIISEKSSSKSPAESDFKDLSTLMQFYEKDLSSKDSVSREYENLFLVLNTWEFDEGEAVPRDHEDLLQFLQKFNLMSSFENIATLLRLALTLPVSSAHDERAFSCLKRVKTYLRSTMSEDRLSHLACISINRETVAKIHLRDLQLPFLKENTRKIFK